MLRVTIKSLLGRKFRLVLTSIAVVLGVAFMAGTFVLTDTLGNVFDGLFADVNRGIDVAVRGKPYPSGQDGIFVFVQLFQVIFQIVLLLFQIEAKPFRKCLPVALPQRPVGFVGTK